jgi:regulator of ribonuclease activity B
MNYPKDANGDALRRMEEAGDDLTRPRNIDFTAVFSNQDAAESFANQFRAHGYAASVEFAQTNEEFPWDVLVVKHMIPTHEGIAAFEGSLQQVASSFGGHTDGWGSRSEPGHHRQT